MKFNVKSLLIASLLALSMPLTGCNKNNTNNGSNDGGDNNDSLITEDPHINHRYYHYDAIEPGCTRPGSKEYWICYICEEVTLTKPDTDNIIDKGAVIHMFGAKDIRYVAPLGHSYHHYNEVPATSSEDGLKEHYECDRCHQYFDTDYNPVDLSELVIPRLNPAIMPNNEGIKWVL